MTITMDEEALIQVKENIERIKTELEESYGQLIGLMDEIVGTGVWQGSAKQAFVAYMDLLKQYHRSFTGENAINPVDMMIQAFEKEQERSTSFYDEFEEYQKIRRL